MIHSASWFPVEHRSSVLCALKPLKTTDLGWSFSQETDMRRLCYVTK